MMIRLASLRNFLHKEKLGAVVISQPENVEYFSGFRGGESMLLVTGNKAELITDFRYVEQAQQEAELFHVVQYEKDMYTVISEICHQDNIRSIGFEGNYMTYEQYTKLQGHASWEGLVSVNLDELRICKDDIELAKMRKAVSISDKAFARVVPIIEAGITEMEIAAELEDAMRRLGSEKPAFDTIVASGVRGSLPHGLATNKVINKGEFVTMDFGAVYQGYHSDITRTVCVGRASDEQRRIYQTVLNAQILGTQSVCAGKSGKEIDAVVRTYIMDAGYGKFFGHGLGHGVGLAIHELPRLSPTSKDECLKANMLVTVEPGIYIPDWGGVRIEDTVMVTDTGCKILTSSDKRLIEVDS